MKYLKFFENSINDIALNKFFEDYIYFKRTHANFIGDVISVAKNYNIPEIFYDEFVMLFFLYDKGFFWKQNIKKEDTYVKNNVKKHILNLIIEKFKNDPRTYILLKKCLDRKFNSRGSFEYIGISTIKYIFFLFKAAIKNAPDWIEDTEKYNL